MSKKEKPKYKSSSYKFDVRLPLQLDWEPKSDITAYELALCLPYLFRTIMPYEINKKELHFRHFKITDHNE